MRAFNSFVGEFEERTICESLAESCDPICCEILIYRSEIISRLFDGGFIRKLKKM